MTEFLYDLPSAAIAGVLLLILLAAVELGVRLGRRRAAAGGEAYREHVNGIQSAALGLLALLLAFTFSLALQRFDGRSDAAVNESNAIGTAYLRADLLPSPQRESARAAIARYLDLRVREATLALPQRAQREQVNADAARAQGSLWRLAAGIARAEPAAHAPMLFVQAVNELIDSQGRRSALLERHVPELVLALLLGSFLLAGVVIGYASGVAAHRPSLATHALILLMVVLVFAILDLDRPRRGIIQVNHAPLSSLQSAIQAGTYGAGDSR